MRNALYIQSGGPTAVINCSACGVIRECQELLEKAWICPFMYLSITMGAILHGLGKTNQAFIHNVVGTVIRLFCLWFLVPADIQCERILARIMTGYLQH